MKNKLHFLLQRSKCFFVNESGLSLLEMAVVLIIVGILLLGVMSKGRNAMADSRLNAAYQTITMVYGHADRYISMGDAHVLTNGGKTLFSKLQENGELDRDTRITKESDQEYMELSHIHAKASVRHNVENNTWCIWVGPISITDAKKLRDKDKMMPAQICKSDASPIENINGELKNEKKEYYLVIPMS